MWTVEQGNEGVHIAELVKPTRFSKEEILRCAQELASQGLVYETASTEQYAVVEGIS